MWDALCHGGRTSGRECNPRSTLNNPPDGYGPHVAVSLSPADREVIARARRVVLEALDRLGEDLVGSSGDIVSTLKLDGTPVTDADVAVHDRLAGELTGSFPDHGILSEEVETVAPDTRWTWVLDPIDGTSNFAAGIPWWCVSIALCCEGAPVWAVVDAPAVEQRLLAEAGRGARGGRGALEVPPPVAYDDPDNRHVPVIVSAGVLRRGRADVHLNPRVLGAVALDLCQVARGAAAAVLHHHPHVWDVAAAGLIVEEAGGALVTLADDPLLPLVAGRDYAGRTAFVAAGPNQAYLEALAGDMPAQL